MFKLFETLTVAYQSPEFLDLALRSVNCFADDAKPSASDLNRLLEAAAVQGIGDLNENRVLRNVINLLEHSRAAR